MRKSIAIGMALTMALMGFMVVGPNAAAHTADAPYTIDLIAGGGNEASAMDVGDVLVWNDADYLYVKYLITDDEWCITETHLHIFLDNIEYEDIPTTKKGNPIPGQFDYSMMHDCVSEYTYMIPLEWEPETEIHIAAHAVVETTTEALIDFEQYNEHDFVDIVSTDSGDVSFYMTPSDPLTELSMGSYAALTPSGLYPEIAEPDTTPPYEDIVAFTVDDRRFGGSDPYRDDYVRDDGGTGAGGKLLTDPQDETQTPLLWHAYSQYQAIVIDLSGVENLKGVNLAGIDLDWGEIWYFQYFDSANTLIYQALQGPSYDYSGDGAAFPIDYTNPDISKIVIWGTNNQGQRERIGFAIDNIEIVTAMDETAWGAGFDFPGNNWATYFTYTVQETIIIITFPEEGNAYIGYEDRTGGDFDYNDFGMNMEVEETYTNGYLTSISLTFTSVINRAGDVHDIHIERPIAGDFTYTVTRSEAAYSVRETAAGEYMGTDLLQVVLFDTARWPNSASQIMGQWVTIEVSIPEDNMDNPYIAPEDLTPPRWDLDPVFAYYDPWMYDRSYGPNDWHIDDMQPATTRLPTQGYDVPYILVVPYNDWPAPAEGQTITGPYPDFDDYYRTMDSAYEDWYLPSP